MRAILLVAAVLAGGQPPPAVMPIAVTPIAVTPIAASQSCGAPSLHLPFPGHYNVVVAPTSWSERGVSTSVARQTFSIEVTDASISFRRVSLVEVRRTESSTETTIVTFTKPVFGMAKVGGHVNAHAHWEHSFSEPGMSHWSPDSARQGFLLIDRVTCTSMSGEVAGLSEIGKPAQRITFTATPDGATKAAYQKAMDAVRARVRAIQAERAEVRAQAVSRLFDEITAAKRPGWRCELMVAAQEAAPALEAAVTESRDGLKKVVATAKSPVADSVAAFRRWLGAFLAADEIRVDAYTQMGCPAKDRLTEIVPALRQFIGKLARDGAVAEALELEAECHMLLPGIHEEIVTAVVDAYLEAYKDLAKLCPNAPSMVCLMSLQAALALERWATLLGGTPYDRVIAWASEHGYPVVDKHGVPVVDS